jgi:hypothetical protein
LRGERQRERERNREREREFETSGCWFVEPDAELELKQTLEKGPS